MKYVLNGKIEAYLKNGAKIEKEFESEAENQEASFSDVQEVAKNTTSLFMESIKECFKDNKNGALTFSDGTIFRLEDFSAIHILYEAKRVSAE
jgi:hypothetical protein